MAESPTARPLQIPSGKARELARDLRGAWEEFFRSGTILSLVRSPIADSWRRSWELGISPTQVHAPIEKGFERLLRSQLRQLLVKAAERAVSRVDDLTEGAALTLTLADADGLVLVQRGDPKMLRRGEALGIVPGSRWSESDAGTNGMGTALFTGQTTQVFAAEHYCEGFHSVVCTAAPVRHPLTGQVLGVFDITTDFHEGSVRVWALATQTAASIAAEMRALLMSGDQVLLEALAMSGDAMATYAVDLEGRRTIENRGAVAAIGPEDHVALWGIIKRALATHELAPVPYQLHSGRAVLVRVNPVTVGDEIVGALVVLKQSRRVRHTGPRADERSIDPDWSPFSLSADWLAAATAAAASEIPVLIIGEPGTGKSAMAAALHRNRRASGGLCMVDCGSLTTAAWEAEWSRALSGNPSATLLVERLDELEPSLWSRLAAVLDRLALIGSPRVMATATAASEDALRRSGMRDDVLDRVAGYLVSVPPLRDRKGEFDRIVHEVLAEVGDGLLPLGPPITDEALGVLRGYGWPGNVRQLQNVLRRALAERPRSAVELKALPAEIVAGAARRHLGKIEQLEVEAILGALRATGGNVSRAAEHLGLSRATIYRRLHAYQAGEGKRGSGPDSEGRHSTY